MPDAQGPPRSSAPEHERNASNLAHAVNNPLFVIVANLETLREWLADKPIDRAGVAEARELVDDAEHAAAQLTEIFAGAFPVVPRATSRPKRFSSAAPATTRRPREVRVLVVDDEPSVARAIKRSLSDYDVRTLGSGRETVALLSEGVRFDLIISDLMMPGMTGMDLHEAVARIDQEQAERMIFATGGATTTRARDFLAAMSGRTIEKPFSMKRLREIISRRFAK